MRAFLVYFDEPSSIYLTHTDVLPSLLVHQEIGGLRQKVLSSAPPAGESKPKDFFAEHCELVTSTLLLYS